MPTYDNTVLSAKVDALETAFGQFQAGKVTVPNLNTAQVGQFHKALNNLIVIDGFIVSKGDTAAGNYATIEAGDKIEGLTVDGWWISGVVSALPYTTYDATEEVYTNIITYRQNRIIE